VFTGEVLIAGLTTSFLTGIQQNPAVCASVKSQANVKLAGGVPFISDADLQAALAKAKRRIPTEQPGSVPG
jgi:hypothetical protein